MDGDSLPTATVTELSATAIKNATLAVNTTIPWDDQEALQERFQQWMRLENLPAFGDLFIGVAWAVFGLAAIAMSYTLWQVVATLAIVEAPQPVFTNDREKANDGGSSPVVVSQQRPTTTSIRTALRTLLRIGGWSALFRGLAVNVCAEIAAGIVAAIAILALNPLVTRSPVQPVAWMIGERLVPRLAGQFVFAQWYTAHTHVVITAPTFRIWYRRLPPWWTTLKATWVAICVLNLAGELTFYVPYMLRNALGAAKLGGPFSGNGLGDMSAFDAMANILAWILAQAARVLVLVPAGVALVRIQTSLLPEDEDTIVPVDRTFGTDNNGKFQSHAPPQGILSKPKPALSFKAAWRTCMPRAEQVRILMCYGKLILADFAMRAAFSIVLGKAVWPSTWNPGNSD